MPCSRWQNGNIGRATLAFALSVSVCFGSVLNAATVTTGTIAAHSALASVPVAKLILAKEALKTNLKYLNAYQIYRDGESPEQDPVKLAGTINAYSLDNSTTERFIQKIAFGPEHKICAEHYLTDLAIHHQIDDSLRAYLTSKDDDRVLYYARIQILNAYAAAFWQMSQNVNGPLYKDAPIAIDDPCLPALEQKQLNLLLAKRQSDMQAAFVQTLGLPGLSHLYDELQALAGIQLRQALHDRDRMFVDLPINVGLALTPIKWVRYAAIGFGSIWTGYEGWKTGKEFAKMAHPLVSVSSWQSDIDSAQHVLNMPLLSPVAYRRFLQPIYNSAAHKLTAYLETVKSQLNSQDWFQLAGENVPAAIQQTQKKLTEVEFELNRRTVNGTINKTAAQIDSVSNRE